MEIKKEVWSHVWRCSVIELPFTTPEEESPDYFLYADVIVFDGKAICGQCGKILYRMKGCEDLSFAEVGYE